MTEIKLSEKIETLLNDIPTQQKPNRSYDVYMRREIKIRKNDRLMRIITQHYIPHSGYINSGFDGKTLHHSGKYIMYPKNSNRQRWMKRLTSKRVRHCSYITGKGNQYRREFDYLWNLD